jgi:hypothetical protein
MLSAQTTLTNGTPLDNDHTLTRNSTIKFNVELSGSDPSICKSPYAIGHDAGFSGWIGQVVASIDNAAAGAPKVSMQSYLYDSDFAVVARSGAKLEAGFTIVPVKGSASYDSSRSDIQHINISIGAVHVVSGHSGHRKPPPVGPTDGNAQQKPGTPTPADPCQPTTTKPGGRPFNNSQKC